MDKALKEPGETFPLKQLFLVKRWPDVGPDEVENAAGLGAFSVDS